MSYTSCRFTYNKNKGDIANSVSNWLTGYGYIQGNNVYNPAGVISLLGTLLEDKGVEATRQVLIAKGVISEATPIAIYGDDMYNLRNKPDKLTVSYIKENMPDESFAELQGKTKAGVTQGYIALHQGFFDALQVAISSGQVDNQLPNTIENRVNEIENKDFEQALLEGEDSAIEFKETRDVINNWIEAKINSVNLHITPSGQVNATPESAENLPAFHQQVETWIKKANNDAVKLIGVKPLIQDGVSGQFRTANTLTKEQRQALIEDTERARERSSVKKENKDLRESLKKARGFIKNIASTKFDTTKKLFDTLSDEVITKLNTSQLLAKIQEAKDAIEKDIESGGQHSQIAELKKSLDIQSDISFQKNSNKFQLANQELNELKPISEQFDKDISEFNQYRIRNNQAIDKEREGKSVAENDQKYLSESKFRKSYVFKLGKPSSILQKIGMPNLPITVESNWYENHILNDPNHNLRNLNMKGLVEAIHNPIAIFQDKNYIGEDGRIELVTTLKGKDGKPIDVIIQFNRTFNNLQVNSIVTAFESNELLRFRQAVLGENTLYIDKSRITDYLQGALLPSLQKSKLIQNGVLVYPKSISDSNTNIEKFLYKLNNFPNKLTNAEIKYQKAIAEGNSNLNEEMAVDVENDILPEINDIEEYLNSNDIEQGLSEKTKKILNTLRNNFGKLKGKIVFIKDANTWNELAESNGFSPNDFAGAMGYDDETGEIVVAINPLHNEGNETIVHEMLHAFTKAIINHPQTSEQKEFVKQLTESFEEFKKIPGAKDFLDGYVFKDIHEFITYTLTNPDFQEFLKNNEPKPNWFKKLLAKINDFFGTQFGVTPDMFEKVFSATNRVISISDYKDIDKLVNLDNNSNDSNLQGQKAQSFDAMATEGVISSNLYELEPEITEEKIKQLYDNYIALMGKQEQRKDKGMAFESFKALVKDMNVINFKNTYIFGKWDYNTNTFMSVFNSSPTSKELLSEAIPYIANSGFGVVSFIPEDMATKYERSGYIRTGGSFDYNFHGEDMRKVAMISNPDVALNIWNKLPQDVTSKDAKDYSNYLFSNEFIPKVINSPLISERRDLLLATLSDLGVQVKEVPDEDIEPYLDGIEKVIYIKDIKDLPQQVGKLISFMMHNTDEWRIIANEISHNKKLSEQIIDVGEAISNELAKKEPTNRWIKLLNDFLNIFKFSSERKIENIVKHLKAGNARVVQQTKTGKQVNPQRLLNESPREAAIVKQLIDIAELAGSIKGAEEGTIHRGADNGIHDLDFTTKLSKEEIEKEIQKRWKESKLFRIIEPKELNKKIDFIEISAETPTVSFLVYENNSDWKIKSTDGYTARILSPEGIEYNFSAMTNKVYLIDDNSVTDIVAKEAIPPIVLDFFIEKNESTYQDMFKAKFSYGKGIGRQKDLYDYNRFRAFKNQPALDAQKNFAYWSGTPELQDIGTRFEYQTYRSIADAPIGSKKDIANFEDWINEQQEAYKNKSQEEAVEPTPEANPLDVNKLVSNTLKGLMDAVSDADACGF